MGRLPRYVWIAALMARAAFGADTDLFEKKIRPVLASKCYPCHSSKLKTPMGGLLLDTAGGIRAGGASGPAVIPGRPAKSRLLQALRYTDPHLQMPPTGKLPDLIIADFEAWIASGAAYPPGDSIGGAALVTRLKGMSLEEGRKWWAFQPLKEQPAPQVAEAAWARTRLDSFILAKLEAKALRPSPPAGQRTLVQRAYIDLAGYKPTYEEVEAFANDSAPNAYERLIDRLLASPQYG